MNTRVKTAVDRISAGIDAQIVVYPDGIWYSGVDPKTAERIVREDLLPGRPITPRTQPADGHSDLC